MTFTANVVAYVLSATKSCSRLQTSAKVSDWFGTFIKMSLNLLPTFKVGNGIDSVCEYHRLLYLKLLVTTALLAHRYPTIRKLFDFFFIIWWTPWGLSGLDWYKFIIYFGIWHIQLDFFRCKKYGGANGPMEMSYWVFHNSGIICLNGLPSTTDISCVIYVLTWYYLIIRIFA